MTYNQQEWLGLFLVFCVSAIYQPKTGTTSLFSQVYAVVSAKTTELLQLTNPLLSFRIQVSMAIILL